MSWKRDQLAAAERLLKERRYEDARALLARIDHPRARQMLERLTARDAARTPRPPFGYTTTAALIVLGLVVACGLAGYLLLSALRP